MWRLLFVCGTFTCLVLPGDCVNVAGQEGPQNKSDINQLAKLTASDGQASYEPSLGGSVAIGGTTIAAGAPGTEVTGIVGAGAVYIFTKPESGWRNMTQVAKLTASDPGYVNGLGLSVAISGDTIIAGSEATVDGHVLQGAVYVFVKPSTGWTDMTQTAKLIASDGRGDDLLGASVSISGDTIVAGAPHATGLAGKAYIFAKPAKGWINMAQTAELTPSDPITDSIFGSSVAIQGSTVAVGEPYKNLAYIFVKPSSGWANMNQTAEISPTDGEPFDEFGYAMAVERDTVVVGKPSVTNPGAVYIFVEPAGGWANMTQTAKIAPSDGAPTDYFGSSVFTNGVTVFAGASEATVGSNGQEGASYLFLKPSTGWKNTSKFKAKLVANNGSAEYFFGASVSANNLTWVVGAPDANVGSDTNEPGAVYVFGP